MSGQLIELLISLGNTDDQLLSKSHRVYWILCTNAGSNWVTWIHTPWKSC